MEVTVGRRKFLLSSGAAFFTLPLLNRRSRAAGTQQPKRFCFFHSHFGVHHPDWWPTVNGNDFTLQSTLEPLTPFKQDVVVIDGLNNPPQSDYDPHFLAFATFLTGTGLIKGPDGKAARLANGTSIDQVLARTIGTSTPLPSIHLSAWPGGPADFMCYSAPGVPVRPSMWAMDTYRQIFGDLAGNAETAARRLAERRSILDNLTQELNALGPKLGASGKHSLERHLESVREVEKRIEPRVLSGDSCVRPTEEAMFNDFLPHVHDLRWYNDTTHFPELVRLNLDLIAMAFACDATRVATIQVFPPQTDLTLKFVGATTSHHGYSHVLDIPAGEAEVEKGVYRATQRWLSEQFAYLMNKLKAIPEGDGNMLSNSLLMWGQEFGDPHAHSPARLPVVLAGNAGGTIKTGRYLRYATSDSIYRFDGPFIGDLHTSICHAFGKTDVTHFGTQELCRGPLPGLVG